MGEHVNTFSKGMTSDVNVIYQPDGTYRFMKNCSLISQDGNNFVIKDCLGNVGLFNINVPYYDLDPGPPPAPSYQVNPMPIGFISFPNKLIVFSTNAEAVDGNGNPIAGYGEIGVIEYTNYGQGIQPTQRFGAANQGYRPLYHHIDLNFSKLCQIEGFAYDENNDTQRVYWTDNLNEPRVINVSDPIYTTYFGVGALVVGEQYMILEGIIEDTSVPGTYYGPGMPNGNIFTATAGPYTDVMSPSPSALIIKYYPIELFAFTPSRSLGTMKFLEYGTGNVLCGSKIYFHRLYDTDGNVATSWSYGSSPIHVGTTNSVPSVPTNFYFDFTGGGNSTTTLNSGNSVFITIDNIDQNFDRIQVACAEFDQLTDVPRQISIVADLQITGTSMNIEHTGNTNLGDLTLSDITLFPASIITCKSMTTNKNYILIGNVQERTEFEYDTSGITATEIEHKFPVHETNIDLCNWTLEYPSVMVQAELTSNPSSLIEYTQWIVTDDSGGAVTYNAQTYSAGDVFTAVPGVAAVTIPGSSQIRPCVYKQKYVETGGTVVYDVIQLTKGYWTYKDPAVAHHVKGYWPGETYRWAIVFFDLKGNPFYARWITDFQFEDQRTSGISETNDYYSLKAKGLRFDNIQIDAELASKIKGFSIMRADRDQNIITQGLLWQTSKSGTTMEPCAFPEIQKSSFGTSNDPYYTLICPDRLVDQTMPDYLAGKQIKEASWLKVVDFNGGVAPLAYGKNTPNVDVGAPNQYQFEVRMIEQLADDAVTNEQDILSIRDVVEDESVSNFGSGNLSYINRSEVAPAPTTTYVNDDCFAGSPAGTYGFYDIAGRIATAGARSIVELASGMSYYTRTTSYGAMTGTPAGVHKLLVNVTNKKTVFYGGQSDSAKANTYYISTGHFQPITPAILASVETAPGSGIYEFNGIDIWGGDAFVSLIDYGASIANQNLTGGITNVYSMGLKFPCYTNANYELRRGRTVANNKMHGSSTGVVYNYLGVARLEGFSYNKGYSSEGVQFAYPALPIDAFFEQRFKTRIRFAGQKIINEYIDSFRTFLINDYKDLSGTFGEINNLKTKDDRTIVWQNKAVATVPILERQIIASSSGQPTTLGTGGVVDRYDLISDFYGNQHQWSVVETEYGFAWFDMRRKAVMMLDAGLQEISAIEGLKGFFSEVFLEVIGNTSPSTNLLNDPASAITQDRPLIGNGITSAYDPKFKYTYLVFKFKTREDLTGGKFRYINKDFTVAFYHPTKMFICFIDWTPAIAHNHFQTLFSANAPTSKMKYYGANMASTTFEIGDVVPYENAEYICISPVTIASYPGTSTQLPTYPSSTYWVLINKTNQLFVHNQPGTYPTNPAGDYEYSKFFGRVVDNEVHFIINPKAANPFNVTHMEQKGNNVNVTSIYTYTDSDSASDVDIKPYSKFYKWIWDRITSSLPLNSKGGRLTDSYLKVVLIKRNWTGNTPYSRTGSVKILQYVKSFFQEKR